MTKSKQKSFFTYFEQHCIKGSYKRTQHINRKFLTILEHHFIGNYFKELDVLCIMYLFDDEDAGYIYTATFDENQITAAKRSVFTSDKEEYIGLDLLFTEEEWSDKAKFSKLLAHKTRLAFEKMLDLAEKEGLLLDRKAAVADLEKAIKTYEAEIPKLTKI